MNPKIVLAFVGGLIVASGLTYIALKPAKNIPVQTAQTTPAQVPAAAEPAPVQAPEPVADSTIPPPEAAKPSPAVGRFKRVPERAVKAAPSRRPSNPAPVPAPVNTASNTPPPAVTPAPPAGSTTPPAPPAEPERNEPAPYSAPKIDVPPPPNKVTIPAGTMFTVRLGETLSTEKNQPGDSFTAVLDQPVVVDGFVIAERGSRASGRIAQLERAGKVQGVAQLALELTQIRTSDGQSVKINTGAFKKQGEASKKKDATKVGVGAAIGAAIGAIAGGGKGAAIGAGVGGAAGAGDVLLTRGQPAVMQVETRVTFRLAEPVTVTERTK